jgi:flagellar hook protein FlgE
VTVGASNSVISTITLFPTTTSSGLTQQSTSSGATTAVSAASVSNITQNGSPIGELTGVSINAAGFVVATFSNGQSQEMFQVPLANVGNPDGLEGVSGNAYEQTIASGVANLYSVGQGGTGTITASALEESNVDLSTQLTDLIVAQQAYGANSKVLTIADQLLQQLDQVIQ